MIIWVIECIESEDVKVGLLLSWLLLFLFFVLNRYIYIYIVSITVIDYILWLLLFLIVNNIIKISIIII